MKDRDEFEGDLTSSTVHCIYWILDPGCLELQFRDHLLCHSLVLVLLDERLSKPQSSNQFYFLLINLVRILRVLLAGYFDLKTGFVILSFRCCIFKTFMKFSSSWTKFDNLLIFFLLMTGLFFLLILITKTPLLRCVTVCVSATKLSLTSLTSSSSSSSLPRASSNLLSGNPLNPNLARISSNRAW